MKYTEFGIDATKERDFDRLIRMELVSVKKMDDSDKEIPSFCLTFRSKYNVAVQMLIDSAPRISISEPYAIKPDLSPLHLWEIKETKSNGQ